MARFLKGSHSFTCTPRVHPLTEWTIPAFVCLPSRSWYSFTDSGGMEGWVGLEDIAWKCLMCYTCILDKYWHSLKIRPAQCRKVLGQDCYTFAPTNWKVLGQCSHCPYGIGAYALNSGLSNCSTVLITVSSILCQCCPSSRFQWFILNQSRKTPGLSRGKSAPSMSASMLPVIRWYSYSI